MNRRAFFKNFGKGAAAGLGVALLSKSLLADNSAEEFAKQNEVDVTFPKKEVSSTETVAGSGWRHGLYHKDEVTTTGVCCEKGVCIPADESHVNGVWTINFDHKETNKDLEALYGEGGGEVWDQTVTYYEVPDEGERPYFLHREHGKLPVGLEDKPADWTWKEWITHLRESDMLFKRGRYFIPQNDDVTLADATAFYGKVVKVGDSKIRG